jgi:molybdopterin/thiamine biosynthesis adenylyltransferase
MIPLLNEALAAGLGVVLFHAHASTGPVNLSGDDRQSACRLLPVFQNLLPGRPHASIVLSDDFGAGMVLLPNRTDYVEEVRVRWLGKISRDAPDETVGNVGDQVEEIFESQALLTGSKGQARLRQATVAAVGLSGGGSHVVQQLAHLGVGRIIGIDADHVDRRSRSRLVGVTALDVLLRRRKTAVMARMVRRINRRVKFSGVADAVPHQAAIDALKEADVIVGCVDSYHARAHIQDLALQYLIPYVDVGLLIKPVQGARAITIGGNVITAIPGHFCLWCIGFLSDDKLAAETGGRPPSYFVGTEKQAQVVSMNGVLASQAVNEVLQLLTGFAPVDDTFVIRKFNGLEGTLEAWTVKPRPDCPKCAGALGAGDVVWQSA